ncbi:unnamed protein product [Adineta steineri]|uniref:Uncharacterized protein n=1 Tax=Adineta steineri TaxID=433720 RepID=A0A814X0Y6_9BILA|nr:unnamed protein product [Adineta steineri]CAF3753322.1 unnamed protein product [Adineta steineri]
MTSKSKKQNNQENDAANSMSESACRSTVSKFGTGDEHEKYWLDENDEENIDELGTKHAELMALPEDLRAGWEILEDTVDIDTSSLFESANQSTQENNDPTNNPSVDDTDEDDSENKEKKSNNKSQDSSKRKHTILTPTTAGTPVVLKKPSRGNLNASSKSTNTVPKKNTSSSAAPQQRIVQLLSDTSNFSGSKDVEKKPDAPSKKDQIRSTTQSSGLASANDEQRALTERDGKPAFLTAAEIHDGKLGCKLHENKHAVYVLTIAVPEWIHVKMLLDQTLGSLKFVQLENVDIDEEKKIVNIKGKIVKRLHVYMAQKIEVNGTKVTRRKLAAQKAAATRRKEFQKPDGTWTTIDLETGRKISEALTRKIQKEDGSWTTRGAEIAEKGVATMSKEIPIAGGTTTILKQKARQAADTKATTMVTLEGGPDVNIDQMAASNQKNEQI